MPLLFNLDSCIDGAINPYLAKNCISATWNADSISTLKYVSREVNPNFHQMELHLCFTLTASVFKQFSPSLAMYGN
jgi:hypothetical protein